MLTAPSHQWWEDRPAHDRADRCAQAGSDREADGWVNRREDRGDGRADHPRTVGWRLIALSSIAAEAPAR
jgi:hypothetical protein